MEQERYVLPQHPAGVNQITLELHSQQTIKPVTKQQLTHCLLSMINKEKPAKVLVLGARCGLTAEILMPACSHLDLVEIDDFKTLLEQRFLKEKEVRYFFAKEGFIGEHVNVPKVKVGQTKVRVIRGEEFSSQVYPYYDLVVLQNCLIKEGLNLVKELIKVGHDNLVTMLVPGRILTKNFFPFICILQKLVINKFYGMKFHQQIEHKKAITGRRTQIFYYEVFGWKKNEDTQDLNIHQILEEAEKQIIQKGSSQNQPSNPYEAQQMVDQYLNFHFGPNSLGVDNFPSACAVLCCKKVKQFKSNTSRALDLGCAVGRTSIDLTECFENVIGLDFSSAFIEAAKKNLVQNHKAISSRVGFVVGDACNLDPSLGKFNLIFGGNLIDRLPNPEKFLRQVKNFLEPQGLLILTSPYTWLEEYTPKEKWIGGQIHEGKAVSTNEKLGSILEQEGFKELCAPEDVRFSIKDNDWVYQYSLACVTFWVKKV